MLAIIYLPLISSLLLTITIQGADPSGTCTAACDKQYPTGTPLVLCGTDLLTHNTTYDAAIDEHCYSDSCGVNTYYAGSCGCPNDCFSSFQRGVCGGEGVCTCAVGWRGKDCSQPAVGNKCSYHGQLISPGNSESVFPFEYCHCDNGWTGLDCSIPVLSTSYLPYSEVFDSPAEYTKSDKYGDNHPIFNTSLIATLRITLPESALLPLIVPENLYNQTYAEADVTFDNGIVSETLTKVGFRLKGDLCRRSQKKCWVIKFNEFVSGQHFKGMKKLGLKGGTNDDDVLSKYMIYVDFLRAMNVPMQRTSYTLMYVNDIFMGLYLMHEYIDDDFLVGHVSGDTGKGNLMKLDGGVFLQYAGPDVATYQSDDRYEQAQGNGDWTDFVSLLQFFDGKETSDETFVQNLESRVRVDEVLRLMIVESFLMNTDGMGRNGHNYNAYHLQFTSDKDMATYPEQWLLINYDFDRTFEYKKDTNTPFVGPTMSDIFGFYVRDPSASSYNPLFNRLLSIPTYRAKYLSMYQSFLKHVFLPKDNKRIQPSVLQAQRMQFILPYIAQDRMWQLSNDMTVEEYVFYAERTVQNLYGRFQNVSAMVEKYQQELMTTKTKLHQ